MKTLLIVVLVLGSLANHISGQSSLQPSYPGILLLQQGKFSEAVRSLETASKTTEYKNDAEIWNYLGLAYMGMGATKKSAKALEKSVELNGSNAVFRANLAYAHLTNRQATKARDQSDKALEIDPTNAIASRVRATVNLWEQKLDAAERDADAFISFDPKNARAYILKSHVLLAKLAARTFETRNVTGTRTLLNDAAEVLKSGRAKAADTPALRDLERELEVLSAFSNHSAKVSSTSDPTATGPGPTVTPLRILKKPSAEYTDAAKSAGVQGSILLKAVLSSDGTIPHVLILSRLGHGLEDEVLEAVRRIKFSPRTVDGKPVSTIVTLEYIFAIH